VPPWTSHSIDISLETAQETIFHFVRDYETVKIEQEVPNEFLLVLDDGGPSPDINDVLDGVDQKSQRREKGAYYKNIERKMILKKKRVNVRLWST
jgi:RNA polymerase II-associated factor 1